MKFSTILKTYTVILNGKLLFCIDTDKMMLTMIKK